MCLDISGQPYGTCGCDKPPPKVIYHGQGQYTFIYPYLHTNSDGTYYWKFDDNKKIEFANFAPDYEINPLQEREELWE